MVFRPVRMEAGVTHYLTDVSEVTGLLHSSAAIRQLWLQEYEG